MKKIIAAMLSAMVGLFGYTLVDTAIETRVSELESRVAELEAYHEYSDVTPDEPTTKPTTKPSVPQPTDELKKIVEDIYANTTAINFEVSKTRDLDLSYPKDVKEFSGLDSADEIHSAVYSKSNDYELLRFLCIVKVKNPASVENLKTEMLEGLDCIKSSEDISEKALVASHNNIILTVMASETIADDIYNAFNIVTGNSASAPLSKYGISGSGKCGDYATWELTPDGTLTISGKGDMYDYDPEWSTYKNYIKEVIIPYGITSIGDQAFENCVNLTSINIPDGVTSIGYCAFTDCSSLTSITLPDSVTTIEWDAFRGCSSLESINIPYGVKEIQADAFADCSSLANVIIPDGVTRIWDSVFKGCSSLESISIPDSVEFIGDNAFEDCTNLKAVAIGKGVERIGNMAFAKCTNLTDVYYAGTEEEWNAIEIGKNNALLTDANIHFNSAV